jgi:hypothetical protein
MNPCVRTGINDPAVSETATRQLTPPRGKMTVPATPARDELLSLFTHRKYGKTEAAHLIDAALAEDRAIRRHPETPTQTAGTCPTCGAKPETHLHRDRPVSLGTDCANCGHPYNWHTPGNLCIYPAAAGDPCCGCTDFTPVPGKNTTEGSEPAHTELSGMAAAADKLPVLTRARLDDVRGHMAGLVRAEHRASHGTEVPKPVLEAHERQFLTYALNLAADRMASEDGFTADDETALASLRRLAEDRAVALQDAAEVRVAALTEAIHALTAEARNLSQQADDEMRRDLEDKAQIWHEAAETLRRLPASPSPDNTGDPT